MARSQQQDTEEDSDATVDSADMSERAQQFRAEQRSLWDHATARSSGAEPVPPPQPDEPASSIH